ncbi:MAG: site-specific tyrosine recombinase XerD [Bacteroidales bacterium]|nr:site-specific tyrosine recombinase XerD [Bacteroidales bacterium]
MKHQTYLIGFKSYLQLERNMSPNTVTAYIYDVGLLMNFISNNFESITIKEITNEVLISFISEIDNMDVGVYTQARIISSVKSFFGFLMLEKIVSIDPTELIESPKLGRKLPDILTINEIEKVIMSVDLSQNEGQRNKAILETLYSCGLRVSELINLQVSNLHFNEGIILVTGKGNKQRLVPIGAQAKKNILIYLEHDRPKHRAEQKDDDILFLNRRGNKLSRQMIFYIVKSHVEKTGINKNISPHSFRHSYATHLVQNGADLRVIQELLGHASINTTEIYTHLDREDLRKVIMQFHPRNR